MNWIERKLPVGDLAIAPAGDPVIASLFVDDGMPGLNPMRLHQPHYGHRPEIPNAVLAEFADLVEREGLAGKFSVVPYPLGLGRIDQEIPGVPDAVVRQFVALVREHLAPRFGITPEVLTHGPALDPHTRYLTHLTEKEWGAGASAAEWAEYVRLAYRLLGNVGLEAGGVTSPWDTGAEGEDAYAEGIGAAGLAVGLEVSFYFLHAARTPEEALPEVRLFRPARDGLAARAVVSLRCAPVDPLWPTQYGGAPRLDDLIDAEGGGLLPALGDAGAPMVPVTHWQCLYGNGARRAPEVLGALARRLRQRYGPRLEWWSAGRMAQFAAAAYGARLVPEGERLFLELAFPLEGAQLSLDLVGGRRLQPASPQGWRADGEGAHWRFTGDFRGRVELGRLEAPTPA